jgi:chromosome segregation ATPase
MKLTATLLFAACRCAVIGGANGATVDSSHLRGGSSPSSVDFEPVSAATIVRSNAALSRKKGGKGKGKRGKGKGGKDQDEDENTDDAPCDTTALEEALAECQKDSEACQKENAECDNQVQICTSLKEECEDKVDGLTEELAQCKNDKAQCADELAVANDQLIKCTTDNSNKDEKVLALEQALASANAQLEECQKKLADCADAEKLERLQQEIQDLTEKNEMLKEENAQVVKDAKELVAAAEAKLEEARNFAKQAATLNEESKAAATYVTATANATTVAVKLIIDTVGRLEKDVASDAGRLQKL